MTEKIYIGIDDKRIELKGEELEAFLEKRAIEEAEAAEQERLIKAEQTAKAAAKAAAQAKLAALGLTVEDLQALGL
jgi:hypothetical protein